jgi:hypothetical protein
MYNAIIVIVQISAGIIVCVVMRVGSMNKLLRAAH